MGVGEDPRLQWLARGIPKRDEGGPVYAPEPPSGWPPRPWDHRELTDPEGRWTRVAVSIEGEPLIDADGDAVLTGPGYGFRLVKAGWNGPSPPVPPPRLDALDGDAAMCIYAAVQIAVDHGHTWVGTEHSTLATLREGSEVRSRFGSVLDPDVLEAAIAKFYDGPAWQRRLEVVAGRREGSVPRPGAAARPDLNHALVKVIQGAQSIAARSGASQVSPAHVVLAELFSARSLTLSLFDRVGVESGPILERALSIRDWLPLIELVDEAEEHGV